GLCYTNENGEKKPVVMGSYGIGLGRVIATIVELRHDDKGIIWPENIAPYKVMLVGLNPEDERVKSKAEALYEKLNSLGIEVLYDDREDITAGQKFADCDLIGIPYRILVSQKTGEKVEFKKRNEKDAVIMSEEEAIASIS
ncbi:MAG TPA: His/Gly/Thr/Pro-type tRNA ligase C-terminal domain-containing protein, partial [Treponemataceae bacterium]|nr:His/Gly/Thr/Pro-type tRNA ligase C-terminal domain-containing protein [Treponemataceae bacterium]